MRLVFLGRPGAGKGTQALRAATEFDLVHVSTGELLRTAMRQGTKLGKEAKGYVDEGRLVPDELVVKLVEESLRRVPDRKGFVLDGFPRNLAQAEALEEALRVQGEVLDAVVYFAVRSDTVLERLSGRRTCPKCGRNYHVKLMPPASDGRCDACGVELIQRKDDRPDAIRERLSIYDKETAPLIDFYRARGALVEVPGDDDEESVARRVSTALATLSDRSGRG
ncbi:MAG: adenylate kinase [Planctomycetota bacterium]